jgi:predicted transglutaminase-like cysteine proteinase
MQKNMIPVVDSLQIGEPVELPLKGKNSLVKGELRQIYEKRNKIYLAIYSFSQRKEIIYRINSRKELILQKKRPWFKIRPFQLTSHSENSVFSKITGFLFYPVAVILILALIVTSFPEIPNNFKKGITYQEFLDRKMNFYQLFTAINAQLSYRYDLSENWMTPEDAWGRKTADCEEYSAICSDYLNRRGIENYLIGITFGDRQGHAVVFARDPDEKNFYILDLTRALEKWGVKKLKADTLADAVKVYTQKDAYHFKIPSKNGEKQLINIIQGTL